MKPNLSSTLRRRSKQQVATLGGNQKWTPPINITAAIFFNLVFAAVCSAQSSREDAPAEESFERRIYFKLPLAQPRFHWCFADEEKLIKGELTLQIQSKGAVSEFTIFKEGKFSNDWIPKRQKNGFYFMFRSRESHKISREDNVTLQLSVLEDLNGIGSDASGILKAGTYRSKGRFTIYETERDESDFAFLSKENWDPLWNLEITSNKGWQEEQYDEKKIPLESGRENYLIRFSYDEGGTRSASIVDHSSKEFYFESFRNHTDFLQYVSENREQLPLNIECGGGGDGFVEFCEALQKELAPIVLSYFDGKSLIGEMTVKDIIEAPNYYRIYQRKEKAGRL